MWAHKNRCSSPTLLLHAPPPARPTTHMHRHMRALVAAGRRVVRRKSYFHKLCRYQFGPNPLTCVSQVCPFPGNGRRLLLASCVWLKLQLQPSTPSGWHRMRQTSVGQECGALTRWCCCDGGLQRAGRTARVDRHAVGLLGCGSMKLSRCRSVQSPDCQRRSVSQTFKMGVTLRRAFSEFVQQTPTAHPSPRPVGGEQKELEK